MVLEAVAAVDGTVVSGLERDLGGCPALRADSIEHFAVVAARGFAASTAVLAADRLVLEPFLRVKLLLAGCKDEFLTAILAYQCFVLEHLAFPLCGSWKFLISECRLTWFLPPHPPTGSVATRRCASHYCLSRNACFRYASVGLTSRPHHAHGALPAYVDRFACDWHRFSTTDPIRGYQS